MEKGHVWGCFKRRESCQGKISVTDNHAHCLICLGEGHIVETCIHCSKFMRQLKNRAAHLQHSLLQLALDPMNPSKKSSTSTQERPMSVSAPPSVQMPASECSIPSTSASRSGAMSEGGVPKKHRDHKPKKEVSQTEVTTGNCGDDVSPVGCNTKNKTLPYYGGSLPLDQALTLCSGSEEEISKTPAKSRGRSRSRSPSVASRLSRADYIYTHDRRDHRLDREESVWRHMRDPYYRVHEPCYTGPEFGTEDY